MDGQTTVQRGGGRKARVREDGTSVLPARPPVDWKPLFERIALFTVAMDKGCALELLEGLGGPHREAAAERARVVLSLESLARQGRVAQEFGERPDAALRLRALIPELTPALQRALARRVPSHLRSVFPPSTSPQPQSPDAADAAWVDRLSRETIR